MKIIYKDENNRVHDSSEATPGMILAINKLGDPEWIRYDAETVPYNDITHLGITNVEEAIQNIYNFINDLKSLFDKSDLVGLRRVVAQSEEKFSKLERLSNGLSQSIEKLKHPQTTVSQLSNPAIIVDEGGQIVTLNLRAAGSYKNAASGAKADNIQQAIDELFSLVRIAPVWGNLLERDSDGALMVKPLQINTNPVINPVEVKGTVVNLSPSLIAHIRRPAGNNSRVSGGGWSVVQDLPDVVFDSLAGNVNDRMVTPGQAQIMIRRDGYYLAEASAPLQASISINDIAQNTDTYRGRLKVGDRIGVTLYADEETTITESIDLFVQWLG